MRITCPECQFKGLIDTAPLAFETRVACVRCGTTFDAVLVEGEVRTSLPTAAAEENLPVQAITPDAEFQDIEIVPEVEDVLALPQTSEESCQLSEQSPVLESVLSPVEAAGQEDAQAGQMEATAATQAVVAEESETQWLEVSQSLDSLGTGDEEISSKFGRTAAESAAEHDRHGMGMRLMRISPLWLLICGVTFVSVIVLSNQFARPAEPEQRVAANYTAPSNKATNQSASQPPAPASANSAATSVQDYSQTAAPAPVELAQETKAVADKAETKPQSDVQSAPPAPVAETKSVVVDAPGPESEKAGGLTIQVGSYNVIEQANERVARLQSAGFDARVATIELAKRGTWYRVQAGRFSSREEATRYGNELKAKGAADNFIITETAGGR